MSSKGDSVEIMGKNALIGEMNKNLLSSQTDAFLNNKKAKAATNETFEANRTLLQEKDTHNKTRAELEKVRKELEEHRVLLVEWMHSNEAFKQLSKQYATALQMTTEQRQANYASMLVSLAAEKPEYQNTKVLQSAREKLEQIKTSQNSSN